MSRRLLSIMAVVTASVSLLMVGPAQASQAPFGPTDSCDELGDNFSTIKCYEFVIYGWWHGYEELDSGPDESLYAPRSLPSQR
jgi:hypothetical protein